MRIFKCLVGVLSIAFVSSVFAAPITYILGDHADGALYDGSTNPYGLRMDDTGQTFTAGDNLPGLYNGGPTFLTFDPVDFSAGAVLTGVLVDNSTGIAWDLTYTLSDLTAAANGGFIAQTGSGTLSEQGGSGVIVLTGMSDGTGVFIFDNDGHRLDGDPGTGWVGRGWLEGNRTNDFLVTANPIPIPAAVWLFGSGLVGLVGLGRRRRT